MSCRWRGLGCGVGGRWTWGHEGKGLTVELKVMGLGVSHVGVGERCPCKRVGRGARTCACGGG